MPIATWPCMCTGNYFVNLRLEYSGHYRMFSKEKQEHSLCDPCAIPCNEALGYDSLEISSCGERSESLGVILP